MRIGIGIDTGGTYTDAVAFDYESRCVLAKGKSRTTKEDLSRGICGALDFLPREYVAQATHVALSTTLATNACVEGKGGRAKLVLMGTTPKVLSRIDAAGRYGLSPDEVLCLDTHGSFDGSVVDMPDWEKVLAEQEAWFADAEALGFCEAHAARNGAVCETAGKQAVSARYDVPIIVASDLASDVNMMERGATALLNARLLPVIEEFLCAVGKAFSARGVAAPMMVVRSDGSLMGTELASIHPVETILSGPASSVRGAGELSECENCLIVDMGGTTTDLSLVVGSHPVMSEGIRIGSWKTQIKGVFIETFGLGGDSAVCVREGKLALSERRVEPISAAAERWPELADKLEAIAQEPYRAQFPPYEALYLVRELSDPARYTDAERRIVDALAGGPLLLGEMDRYDLFMKRTERLESEGVVMRCGLTPTDMMQIKGDFDRYDPRAAIAATKTLAAQLPACGLSEDPVASLADAVYDAVERKLYGSILRMLLRHRYGRYADEAPDTFYEGIFDAEWARAAHGEAGTLFDIGFASKAALVGIGAPTHIFLPAVARALDARCVIPPDSEVANAVGAVTTTINVRAVVRVVPQYDSYGIIGYRVHLDGGQKTTKTKEEALAIAQRAAREKAELLIREQGAIGRIECEVHSMQSATSATGDGQTLDLGTDVVASAWEVDGFGR